MITTENIKFAYKKLKSHLYSDKLLLQEKIELAKFEDKLEDNLQNLENAINKKDISQWLNQISFRLIPKKLKDKKHSSSNYFSNKTINDKYEVESYNVFIKAPIEIHLVSVLWTMFVGEKLDKSLQKNSKGNRVHRDKNNKFLLESYKLFSPYYEGYQSFRDDGIQKAINLHKEKLDVTVLNLDIKEFYYNIAFEFKSIELLDEYGLNGLMEKIHETFHTEIKGLHPNIKTAKYGRDNLDDEREKFLPIGLVSSGVIANYVLKEFDEDVVNNLKPEYYGRYVDDMIFVFSNASIDLNSKTLVCDLLKCKSITTNFKCDLCENIPCDLCKNIPSDLCEDISFVTNKRKFVLQSKKVKVLQFYKDDSIAVLQKFKDTIDENSSFFNFMPDDEKLFKTLEKSGNVLFYSDSENKLNSFIGSTKDILKISRNLTGVTSTIASAKFDTKNLNKYNQQLKNVFSGKNIFEMMPQWEKVFTYLYISKNDELFVEMYTLFIQEINKLSTIKSEELKSDTAEFLNNCVKFAICFNPTRYIKIISLLKKEGYIINFEDNILKIRQTNLFQQYLMTFPLLNYCKGIEELDFLTQEIELKDFNFELNMKKIANSPRFFHYHEIALFYHYKFVNNGFKNSTESNQYIYNQDELLATKYIQFNDFKEESAIKFPKQTRNFLSRFLIDSDDKEDKKDKLKIGIVSIKIDTKDIESAYISFPNTTYKRLQKIFDILNESIRHKEHKVDLLVFPEVSIPYAFVHLLTRFAKKNNIGIVCGVEHIKVGCKVSNYTAVMLPFKTGEHTNLFVKFDLKRHYAPAEQMGIESRGFRVNENIQNPILYKWRNSVFTTFNCYELTDISKRSHLVGEVDFIVAIEYNHDTNYFANIIESTARDVHCYIVQVNTSDFGDSRIIKPSKTESKDIVKIKGGENVYLVVDEIDIKKLRDFQEKGHCLQKDDKDFKLVPPKYKISDLRK